MSSISLKSAPRGATLPLTVIVLALMAVAVAITFSRVSAERAINADRKAQQGAFAVAQSGLSRYLASFTTMPNSLGPWPVTTTYNDLPGGTAQIEMRLLRDSTITMLPAVYIITSRGRYTAARRYNSLTPSAERVVASYALWTPMPFDLNAAFTSLTGVLQNGAGSGGLSGVDHCALASGGGLASIPGVAVPTTGGVAAPADYSGSTAPIDGNPDNTAVSIGTPGTAGTAKDAVGIDWAGILAGTALHIDNTSWPASTATWPVTKITGDFTLPASGNGILIVTGNLTINGTPLKNWNGLILVGGNLLSNGAMNVYGAIITGLNIKTGGTAAVQSVGNGTKTFQYDSCALKRALGHVGYMQRVRNGWTDTWSSYQ
jgi:hypothetical protein